MTTFAPGLKSPATQTPPRTPAEPNLLTLVQRMTFGPTGAELALAAQLGVNGYIEHHLNPSAIDDSVLEARVGTDFPALALTPQGLSGLTANPYDVRQQLIRARILRAVLSRRQLLERVVEVWSDHFSIYIDTSGTIQLLKVADDRDAIRANALGTFPQLLRASARSPAMLAYLNNNSNVATGPNENYARELMELHALGVDGGYTQNDVRDVARCFTGWTFFSSTATDPTTRFSFRYNNAVHDQGAKVVLGTPIPASGGQQDGETVLTILANHPSTARMVARKLLTAFWGDRPPAELVGEVAGTYTRTGGDIRSMLRHVLGLLFTGRTIPTKYKRPLHQQASALRALGATVTTPGSLQSPLLSAGHLPFNWVPPDGYPDTLEDWAPLVLPRWNFGGQLLNNEYAGVTVDTTALLAGVANTRAAIVQRINDLVFFGRMTASDAADLRNYLAVDPPTSARVRETFGLALGAPSFQLY
jgi:hypothetical protein